MTISFFLNGKKTTANINSTTMLIDLLRDKHELISVKDGCRCGVCGHCTVLIDNVPFMSCQLPVFTVLGKKIMTFEGFSQTEDFADYINALRKEQVRLCDFCQPGKLLTLHSILETMEEFDSSVILKAMNSHKCRCTTYSSLLKAAKRIYNAKRRRQRAGQ